MRWSWNRIARLRPVGRLAGINPELQYSASFLTVIRLGPRVIIGQQRETGRTTTFNVKTSPYRYHWLSR